MISERLRNRALARTCLKKPTEMDTADASLDYEAAYVIDALVAALVRLRSLNESGGDPFEEPGRQTLKQADAALAMARRK